MRNAIENSFVNSSHPSQNNYRQEKKIAENGGKNSGNLNRSSHCRNQQGWFLNVQK